MSLFSRKMDSYKTVYDLPDLRLKHLKPPIQQEKRSAVRIAIIDDQPFEASVNLRNHGFIFQEIGDIKNINEVASYPIVLCDLMDVGLHFNKAKQGAAIISEIRKNYPATLIAAYSGSPGTAAPVAQAKQLADGFIKKDAEIEDWVNELDRLISLATDARHLWLRTRLALVEMTVDTKTILKMEDAYVQSFVDRDSGFSAVRQLMGGSMVSAAASNVMLNLISSGIFEVLVE